MPPLEKQREAAQEMYLRTTGRIIRRIITNNREYRDDPDHPIFVEIDLRYPDGASEEPVELHATEGWKIVSSMINTVRYSPEIQWVRTHRERNGIELEFIGAGGYAIASFVAIPTEGTEFPVQYPFELRPVGA